MNVVVQVLLNAMVIMSVRPIAIEVAFSTGRRISGANADSVMGPALYHAAITDAKGRQALTPITKTAIVAMEQA